MKKIFQGLLVALTIVTLVVPLFAKADGMLIPHDWNPQDPQKRDLIDQTNQQAFINFEDGLEKMIISVGMNRENKDAVWIFPVPAEPKDVIMDVLEKMPELKGVDIKQEAENEVPQIFRILRFTQIYPWIIQNLMGVGYAPPTPGYTGAPAGGYFGAPPTVKGPEPEVVVYEHLEKAGMTLELITAKRAEALYDYLKEKGLKVEKGSIPILDEYIGKDYSFICGWISGEILKEEEIKKEEEVKKEEEKIKEEIKKEELKEGVKVDLTKAQGGKMSESCGPIDNPGSASTANDIFARYRYGYIQDQWSCDEPFNSCYEIYDFGKLISSGKIVLKMKTENNYNYGVLLQYSSDKSSWHQFSFASVDNGTAHNDDRITTYVAPTTWGSKTNVVLNLTSPVSLRYIKIGRGGAGSFRGDQEVDFLGIFSQEVSYKSNSKTYLTSLAQFWDLPQADQYKSEPKPTPEKEQRGVFITFPVKGNWFLGRKIFYPLLPTSIYESKKIPIEIRILGYIKPEIYQKIKTYTETSYWQQDKLSIPEELKDFYGNIKTDKVKYTKIEIKDAPSKYLVDDLWMKRGTPIKISLASGFANHPKVMGFLVLLILSFISGLAAGVLVFKKKIWKYGLLGLTNIASIIGLIIGSAVITTKRPEISEKAREMLEELKKAGVSIRRWDRRKLWFVLLFTIVFVILTYGVENLLKWYF